jgi:hypothetical protein
MRSAQLNMNHGDTEAQSASARRRRDATRAAGLGRKREPHPHSDWLALAPDPTAQAGPQSGPAVEAIGVHAARFACPDLDRLCVSVSPWLILSPWLIFSVPSVLSVIS